MTTVSMSPVSMSIDQRIHERRAELSPQERRAADTLLAHSDDLGTYRASELASLAGVSKATMSRLFRSLGFADFDEVREHLRARRSAGEPRRVDAQPSLLEHAAAESDAILAALDHSSLAAAVSLLVKARRVTLVGWRNSYPVAMHLRQQLTQARQDVRLVPQPGQVIGEEVADFGPGDVVVVVGFRRRPAGFARFLAATAATEAEVVLIADPTAREYARHSAVWLECGVESGLAFDSYAAAMSVSSVLADRVLSGIGRPGGARTAAITKLYAELGEVE